MTQLEWARKNKITPAMRRVARAERVAPEAVRAGVADGVIVIPGNAGRRVKKPCGIGRGLRVKINANIGTSKDRPQLAPELAKLKACVECGADTVMDLSTGGDLRRIRRAILRRSSIPVGTVPIYEAAVDAARRKKSIVAMTAEEMLATIESQAVEGVDFVTVHTGVTRESIGRLKREGRLMGVVSRGGAFLVEWMLYHGKENPLYERFDRILAIARRHDLTLSLGDGLRPGALADAGDRGQFQELIILGEQVKAAREAGVQVMVEGPGHVPMNQIAANVELEKRLCGGAPFYVLGPLVTDVAPGYDHISGAIGGAIAAQAGADFLCYVTPSEHLRLPDLEDVREGVIAARIAAHAADLARGIKAAWQWDERFSRVRRKRDWEKQIRMAIDPVRARKLRKSSRPREADVCTMCGRYCAIKQAEALWKDGS